MNRVIHTAALIAIVSVAATAASAGGWRGSHPRRVEVNARLENQHDRISAGLQDGQLSQSQAQGLAHEDHTIRTEERDMAHLDDGHITRADQRSLNQQENAVSTQIYEERH
ncbi:MAG TPA: hypothetical protein VN805_11415 [Caulobacteraceae bacterium]|nr:hypothetical protein [Caulobacteraceae bacterium]